MSSITPNPGCPKIHIWQPGCPIWRWRDTPVMASAPIMTNAPPMPTSDTCGIAKQALLAFTREARAIEEASLLLGDRDRVIAAFQWGCRYHGPSH